MQWRFVMLRLRLVFEETPKQNLLSGRGSPWQRTFYFPKSSNSKKTSDYHQHSSRWNCSHGSIQMISCVEYLSCWAILIHPMSVRPYCHSVLLVMTNCDTFHS